MEDYIRKAFKSLEDFKVEIEPVVNPLKEAIDEVEDSIEGLTVRGLFEKEASYIITHEFESAGHTYSLFLEALHEGESCDIEFEEFDIANIDGVLVEVLDSEHEFLGSLTGEDITLETPMEEVLSKAEVLISGEEVKEEPEAEEEANERVFINGDPDMESEETVEVEQEVHEEVLTESEVLDIQKEEDVKKADKILKQDASEAIEQIVDTSAESKEDLKKTYVGSIILQCPTCKSMMYKDPDQLVKVEGKEELYNIDEECPHCGAKDGFEIVGQVASLDVDPEAEPVPPMTEEQPEVEVEKEETVEIEPEAEETHEELESEEEKGSEEEGKPSEEEEEKEDDEVEDKEEKKEEESKEQPLNEEHCEIKLTTEEKNMLDKLTHGNKMDCWFWIDDETDEIKDLEDGEKVLDTCEAILTVADGTDNVEEFLNEEEVKLFNDLVARCKECKGEVKEEVTEEAEEEKHVCEKCGKEVCECDKLPEEKKEEEIKLESFDEDKFDRLVTRYLKETYSNVKSYKTVKAGLNDGANKVVMEGMITFKSEKQKPTKFVFEAKELNAKKQLKLVGINEMFSAGKAFTLLGTVDNNKLLSESLSYRYDVNGKKVRGRAEAFRKR